MTTKPFWIENCVAGQTLQSVGRLAILQKKKKQEGFSRKKDFGLAASVYRKIKKEKAALVKFMCGKYNCSRRSMLVSGQSTKLTSISIKF